MLAIAVLFLLFNGVIGEAEEVALSYNLSALYSKVVIIYRSLSEQALPLFSVLLWLKQSFHFKNTFSTREMKCPELFMKHTLQFLSKNGPTGFSDHEFFSCVRAPYLMSKMKTCMF